MEAIDCLNIPQIYEKIKQIPKNNLVLSLSFSNV